MGDDGLDRRQFLTGAIVGGATVAGIGLLPSAQALDKVVKKTNVHNGKGPATVGKVESSNRDSKKGYVFLNPEEAAFVEALADHMVPADNLSPKGTDLGINTFIDRALASGWGKGDRLYMQGPWKAGTASQGYQLPLCPSELFRSGVAASNRYCIKVHKKTFDLLSEDLREKFLQELSGNKIEFEGGPPVKVFFPMILQMVMEGMFSDPIYGGNKDKAGWKMVGFPGVIQNNQQNIVKFKNKKFSAAPVSIEDLS